MLGRVISAGAVTLASALASGIGLLLRGPDHLERARRAQRGVGGPAPHAMDQSPFAATPGPGWPYGDHLLEMVIDVGGTGEAAMGVALAVSDCLEVVLRDVDGVAAERGLLLRPSIRVRFIGALGHASHARQCLASAGQWRLLRTQCVVEFVAVPENSARARRRLARARFNQLKGSPSSAALVLGGESAIGLLRHVAPWAQALARGERRTDHDQTESHVAGAGGSIHLWHTAAAVTRPLRRAHPRGDRT